jgi:hypothetical protein
MTDQHNNEVVTDDSIADVHDDEQDVCRTDMPDIKPLDKPKGKVLRDPVTGKFLAGTAAGPGRPHGAKSQFNKQVIDSLQALWEKNGAEMLDQLAAEKPEVIMGMVSRMIPQALAAEAITNEKADGNQGDTQVTIKVVTDQSRDVLPPREVEGELITHDNVTH